MTIKELEKEYQKKIKALKRSLDYYEKQGRDTSALRDLIKEYTNNSNIRTKTGRIKKQVMRDLESVRAQSLIDRDKKQQELKKQMKERGEENRRREEIKKEMKRERQKQIDKQKALIRASLKNKIDSSLMNLKDADPHKGKPLYALIDKIYNDDVLKGMTEDEMINMLIRELQKSFGEEGIKKGYRIWGQYGLKKIEDAFTRFEKYGEKNKDAERTLYEIPFPIVRSIYITCYVYDKKGAMKEKWEAGQNYFVELYYTKKQKSKNTGKEKTVECYIQNAYLMNVEAIRKVSEEGYKQVQDLLKTFIFD